MAIDDGFVGAVDLTPWYEGPTAERSAVAEAVDASLRRAGFVVVSGHGIDPNLFSGVRHQFADLFALDDGDMKLFGAPGRSDPHHARGTPSRSAFQ